MPTENWYPISGATHDLPAGTDDFSNSGGANKNASVRVGGGRAGPATHDDATTSIQYTGTGASQEQSLNIDWPGPMFSYDGVLNWNDRDNVSSGTGARNYRIVNAAGTAGGIIHTHNNADTYTSYGPTDISNAATYRPGGGSWAVADFDDEASMFARVDASASFNFQTTSIWGQISYSIPTGGFIFALSLATLGVLPNLQEFERFLAWRRICHPRRTRWKNREEMLLAWKDVCAYRWPRYVFLGLA